MYRWISFWNGFRDFVQENNHELIFASTLLAFFGWLALIFVKIIPDMISDTDTISAMTQLFSVFGIGGITTFFTTMLTLEIQFFFRKSKPPKPTVPS